MQQMSSPQRDDDFPPSVNRVTQEILGGRDNTDDIREEAYTKFMDDDTFVKSEVFKEFVWRCSRDEFGRRLNEEMNKFLE